jgi:hypothetical protein
VLSEGDHGSNGAPLHTARRHCASYIRRHPLLYLFPPSFSLFYNVTVVVVVVVVVVVAVVIVEFWLEHSGPQNGTQRFRPRQLNFDVGALKEEKKEEFGRYGQS